MKQPQYPMGSVSCATMCNEDLIPAFLYELEHQAKRKDTGVPAKVRKAHLALCAEIQSRVDSGVSGNDEDGGHDYYDTEVADYDLNESLFDALNAYAGPYFYFGAHPGDGADYGYWLSESWDQDFVDAVHNGKPALRKPFPFEPANRDISLKVNDLSEIPGWFRGEVAVVNDHGNVTLYLKTARKLTELWAVV